MDDFSLGGALFVKIWKQLIDPTHLSNSIARIFSPNCPLAHFATCHQHSQALIFMGLDPSDQTRNLNQFPHYRFHFGYYYSLNYLITYSISHSANSLFPASP